MLEEDKNFPTATALRCAAISTSAFAGGSVVLMIIGVAAKAVIVTAIGFIILCVSCCVCLGRTKCCDEKCCCDGTFAEDMEHRPRKESWRCASHFVCGAVAVALTLFIISGVIGFANAPRRRNGETPAPPPENETAAPPTAAENAAVALGSIGIIAVAVTLLSVWIGRILLKACNCVMPEPPEPPVAAVAQAPPPGPYAAHAHAV